MEITKKRKEELKKQTYGTLQSTPEYKDYLERFVYNNSKLMNEEVEYILKKSYEDPETPFSYDDIPLTEIDYEELETLLKDNYEEELKEWLKDNDLSITELGEEELKECAEDLGIDSEDYEHNIEVYQWFLMDDRLIYQLKQRNEVILNDCYWGRQCCGQAIEMDSIIIQIFKEWYLEF